MDERTLIQQAGAGDAQAFEQLVIAYQKPVYNLALRMTGNREDAFDLTQETFLKAWHAISLFQYDCKFLTWLCRIASNTCIDFLRKERRRKTVSLTAMDDLDETYEIDVVDPSQDPAGIVEQTMDREAVYQALQQLPPEYRAALSMRVMEDMRYEDIAEALNVKPGTVKSRISRAREKLRRELFGNFSASASSESTKGGAAR